MKKILHIVVYPMLVWLAFVLVLGTLFGCATPPPSMCYGTALECRVAKLEREVKEANDLAIMCRRNPTWAICQ